MVATKGTRRSAALAGAGDAPCRATPGANLHVQTGRSHRTLLRRPAEFGFPPIALFVGHSNLHLLGKLQPAGRLKARLPDDVETPPGTFGWVTQACGQREVLWLDAAAVSRIGQLESVRLVQGGRSLLRHVRTGKTHGGKVEILSGLREGDLVLLR